MKVGKPKPRTEYVGDDLYLKLRRAARPELARVLFALRHTGARPSEIYTLRWDQVREDCFYLDEHKTAHFTAQPKKIYLSRPLKRLLSSLKKSNPQSEYVFPNTRGETA